MATPDGHGRGGTRERPISSLRVGDAVEAYDPATGKASVQQVQHVFVNHDTDLLDVTLQTTQPATKQPAANQQAASANHHYQGRTDAPGTADTQETETIHTTANHPWLTADRGWEQAGGLRVGEPVVTANGGTAVVVTIRVVSGAAAMWDLTVSNVHDFAVGSGQFVVHNCDGKADDPVARRVKLRLSTKRAIQDAAPRTADGDFIDPNTGEIIPQDGPFDYGHKPGLEWGRTRLRAALEGWTRRQVIDFENDPDHYQIEDPSSNRSHRFEDPS